MSVGVRSFEDLDVWVKGVDIADLIHECAENFPRAVVYGLGNQMQRSSASVPSNVAEGSERQHTNEYIQYCYIALGSCAELYTQLVIAKRRGYVNKQKADMLAEMINHERRMLKNLIKSLKIQLDQHYLF